ncbi:MAG: response regulator [Nitrospirae bacterium]|nr:response regulator [Nitrospirota bacterium]
MKKKILIADDEPTNRIILHRMLSCYGDCDVVVDGTEVIDAFVMALEENTPYDLICLDIMMPIMTGCEALKKIREIEHSMAINPVDRVSVIMITAVDKTNELIELTEDSCASYMMKPINKSTLIQRITDIGLLS